MNSATKQLIQTAFRTIVETPLSVATYYDNVIGQPDTSTPIWCRHTINETGSEYASLGRNFGRFSGFVSVQLFVPKGSGTNKVDEVFDKLEKEMSGTCTGNVRFQMLYIDFSAETGDWYQTNITIPFVFENNY